MQVPWGRHHARENVRLVASIFSERAELLAIYGALALIAAVVFGTISYHPF